jgi:predicted amidohydrolase YtcJ
MGDRLGTLEPGRLADVVAYPRDPMSMPVDELRSLHPGFTMVGGHIIPTGAREQSSPSGKTR